MLKLRIITATLLALVVLGVLFFTSAQGFHYLVAALLSLCAWEWGQLSGLRSRFAQQAYPAGLLGLCWGVWHLQQQGFFSPHLPFVAAAVFWGLALVAVYAFPKGTAVWGGRMVRALMGAFILVPTALALVFIRQLPQGTYLIVMLLAVVATMDTGAYFSGRAFGKHKLAPNVSPGKSWEGALGGFALALLGTGGLWWFHPDEPLLLTAAVILPAACVSVVGDLAESMVKRHQGVKDSGFLLPGHGGVMDRIDGLSAAAPVFALSLALTGWLL